MMRFSRWILENYKLMERKKAHYSGDGHDKENFPQVADMYASLRNSSKKVLRNRATKDGIDPNEPAGKLTGKIMRKELGDGLVDGYYNLKTDDSQNRVKMRNKAKEAAKPSYRKNDDE